MLWQLCAADGKTEKKRRGVSSLRKQKLLKMFTGADWYNIDIIYFHYKGARRSQNKSFCLELRRGLHHWFARIRLMRRLNWFDLLRTCRRVQYKICCTRNPQQIRVSIEFGLSRLPPLVKVFVTLSEQNVNELDHSEQTSHCDDIADSSGRNFTNYTKRRCRWDQKWAA